VMTDVVTKRPRGFGFVTFVDPASLTAVLQARFHNVDGRLVEVKPADVPMQEHRHKTDAPSVVKDAGSRDATSMTKVGMIDSPAMCEEGEVATKCASGTCEVNHSEAAVPTTVVPNGRDAAESALETPSAARKDDSLPCASDAAATSDEVPDAGAEASPAPATAKIFIGGLRFQTTSQTLYDYFVQFGPLSDAVVLTDVVTKRPRGFGFVTFVDPASLTAVSQARFHNIDSRLVEVKLAVPAEGTPSPEATPPWKAQQEETTPAREDGACEMLSTCDKLSTPKGLDAHTGEAEGWRSDGGVCFMIMPAGVQYHPMVQMQIPHGVAHASDQHAIQHSAMVYSRSVMQCNSMEFAAPTAHMPQYSYHVVPSSTYTAAPTAHMPQYSYNAVPSSTYTAAQTAHMPQYSYNAVPSSTYTAAPTTYVPQYSYHAVPSSTFTAAPPSPPACAGAIPSSTFTAAPPSPP